MIKSHNFGAGPCILPNPVFEEAAEAVKNFNGSGLSILEISHRSKAFVEVIEEARALLLKLMGLSSKTHTALFMHGGASLQFAMAPYNFLNQGAGYINTGVWSKKAIAEAKKIGDVTLLFDGESVGYKSVPNKKALAALPTDGYDYIHLTSNNTIYGTQFKEFGTLSSPSIIDMSSDIFSTSRDYTAFDLIYAGAQKNIGPAGTTIVVIKNQFLEQIVSRNQFSMLDYRKHIEADSMFNTPTVFSIYTSLLNLKWLEEKTISIVSENNAKKARLLYETLDKSAHFKGFADKESRSEMNVTFTIANSAVAETFDLKCKEENIVGIKGHRLVGGYRASLYNALSLESVKVLTDIIAYTDNA